MGHFLVTGGSGFFGGVLKRRLLHEGHSVVNIDLVEDLDSHPSLIGIQGDIRDSGAVTGIFASYRFDGVFHVAAQLAHGMKLDKHLLWSSNVDATRLLAEAASAAGVQPFIFISTNCLWASGLGHPVQEDRDPPAPVELYGRSKLAAEKLLAEFAEHLDVVILRCPTIMDAGRLGLLSILYEFIADNKTVWVVGKGDNRYQFVYAEDLATACLLAAAHGRSDLFHVGSANVSTMRQVYEAVIRASRSSSRVRSLPRGPAIAAMMLAHMFHLSPLGPYHYRMIAESFVFDTSRIERTLGWRPTLTNQQMLLKAYEFYTANRSEIAARTEVSTHSKPAPMGIIRLLKWVS